MSPELKAELRSELQQLKEKGLYKTERILLSPQGRSIDVQGAGEPVLNFCSNNYLGLAADPAVVRAGHDALDRWGFGLSSVRFICGTQKLHKDLESRVSSFLRTEDTLLYSSCFDANGGLFEPLLGENDTIISDALNHASIIDGVRLCKAGRMRYGHADMADLARCLKEAPQEGGRIICTDGVFSMDGDIAPLADICDLAERHGALVMVDDSHATGYLGAKGRGTPALCEVEGRIDLITTTFGKALGGASGGCTSGRAEIIELFRQRSRPYLFSNTLAPAVAGATAAVLDMIEASDQLRSKVLENARSFRSRMVAAGFDLVAGETAIVPVMLYQEPLALRMADRLLELGIYVIGFAYPVVPRGRARIRVQLSAAHEPEDIDRAVAAFCSVGQEMGVI
jgi:glycine C-acetyltransferase